jgi:hypothetical protein
MTEAQLLQNYVRVRMTPARIMIEVKVEAPADAEGNTPSARWSLAAALPKLSLATAVERARLMTVANRRFFRICDRCGDRHPIGRIITRADGSDQCVDCAADAEEDA